MAESMISSHSEKHGDELNTIAVMLEGMLSSPTDGDAGPVHIHPSSEVDLARKTIKARRRREEMLGREFGLDGPWYVLLDLFVALAEGRRVSVTAASLAARGAPSSGLRMVSRMVEAGLLTRLPDSCDGRRSWVTLSSPTYDAVRRLLEAEVPSRL